MSTAELGHRSRRLCLRYKEIDGEEVRIMGGLMKVKIGWAVSKGFWCEMLDSALGCECQFKV